MSEHGSGLIREGGQTRNRPSGRARSHITETTGSEGDSRAALVCCAALGVSGNMLSQTSQNINLLLVLMVLGFVKKLALEAWEPSGGILRSHQCCGDWACAPTNALGRGT